MPSAHTVRWETVALPYLYKGSLVTVGGATHGAGGVLALEVQQLRVGEFRRVVVDRAVDTHLPARVAALSAFQPRVAGRGDHATGEGTDGGLGFAYHALAQQPTEDVERPLARLRLLHHYGDVVRPRVHASR
jgi:hypothetical protein